MIIIGLILLILGLLIGIKILFTLGIIAVAVGLILLFVSSTRGGRNYF